MTNRLARSLPFWVLALVSVASIGFGLWLVLSKTSEMSTTLANETATYEQVYVSPAWVGFGGVLVGAGIIGLLIVLMLAALSAALPQPEVADEIVVEEIVAIAAPDAAADPATPVVAEGETDAAPAVVVDDAATPADGPEAAR